MGRIPLLSLLCEFFRGFFTFLHSYLPFLPSYLSSLPLLAWEIALNLDQHQNIPSPPLPSVDIHLEEKLTFIYLRVCLLYHLPFPAATTSRLIPQLLTFVLLITFCGTEHNESYYSCTHSRLIHTDWQWSQLRFEKIDNHKKIFHVCFLCSFA